MRGILIANPNATTTTERTREVLTGALSAVGDIDVVTTSHAGHAGELAQQASAENLDVIIVLGGDGTVHEVVNGLLGSTDSAHARGEAHHHPALATIPGGSANVLARACGLPNDPVEATGQLLEALREGRRTTIGLGRVNGTWFVANAGLGLDAEIIESMEAQRGLGKRATPTRYLATSVRTYFSSTDRKIPRLQIFMDDQPPVDHVFLAIVQNTSPWTYLGGMAVNPSPRAAFDKGLDIWAITNMRVLPSLVGVQRILTQRETQGANRGLFARHDMDRFTLVASEPTPLQVDGEGLGRVEHVTFESVPEALRLVL